ncbi:cell wall-binding repeat-containing protein [Sutcliffiella cohnii]
MARKKSKKTIFKVTSSILLATSLLLPPTVSFGKDQVHTVAPLSVKEQEGRFASLQNLETRIAGKSRYETAATISSYGWESGADTVVIATGRNFPDVLAGTPLAFQLEAPILLTRPTTLTEDTIKEIKRLGAKKAILLGGKTAITESVEKELRELGVTIDRISGASRADTAVEISKKLNSFDSAIIVDGMNFPDAIAIAPYAAREGIPIFLTQRGSINDATKAQLRKAKDIYIIGGKNAVSDEIMIDWNAKRISGPTRYATVAAIVKEFSFNKHVTYVATGQEYADALTGSVVAAWESAPVLLVPKKNIPEVLKEVYNENTYTIIIGGESAVPSEVIKELREKKETRSQADIRAKWEELQPTYDYSTSKYTKEPLLSTPYYAGQLNEDYLKDALNYTKFIRYLANLPYDDMFVDEDLTDQAQHGALLLSVSNFSHFPSRPADMQTNIFEKGYESTSTSNISYGYESLTESILYGYMRDEWPASNIESVGHRRWILSPSLQKLGFGEVTDKETFESYSTMQVFDTSRKNVDFQYSAWPSAGDFPVTFFHEIDPWSIHLDRNLYKAPELKNVTVTIERLSDKKTWSFNASNNGNAEDFTKNYLNVSNENYGYTYGIIFRPSNLDLHSEDRFKVEVKGLQTKEGQPASITYNVDFFEL